MRYYSLYNEYIDPPERLPKGISEDFIVCSLAPSGALNRLRNRIPHIQLGDAAHTLTSDNPLRINRYNSNAIMVPRTTTFHVFESTARLLALELEQTLAERFK
jgi:hypothetical protein